jgi:hypothetical protein
MTATDDLSPTEKQLHKRAEAQRAEALAVIPQRPQVFHREWAYMLYTVGGGEPIVVSSAAPTLEQFMAEEIGDLTGETTEVLQFPEAFVRKALIAGVSVLDDGDQNDDDEDEGEFVSERRWE